MLPVKKFIFLFFLLSACGGTIEKPAEITELEITDKENLPSIGFDRTVWDIKRGTKVGEYKFIPFHCKVFSGDVVLGSDCLKKSDFNEFSNSFFREMNVAGYNVEKNPSELFGNKKMEKPDILIGAKITGINMSVCDRISAAFGTPLNRQKGEASVKISWQLFSILYDEVIYEIKTQGYAKIEKAMPNGEVILIDNAFADAARRLATKKEFYETLKKYNSRKHMENK